MRKLEERDYEDRFLDANGPDRPGRPTKELRKANQVRLNGLLRLDPTFDDLIDHPRVLPYLREFVHEPQLINTWSISKFEGAVHSGWHRGVPTADYHYQDGTIRSRMFNVVYLLSDNGPDDGCVVALPGSHKSSFDLKWGDYDGLELPGAVPVTGKAGDVLVFSEAVIHNGLLKTPPGVRSNIYFNYTHAHYNVMTREPVKAHFQLKQSQARVSVSARHCELFSGELSLYGLSKHRQMAVALDPAQTGFDVEQCRGYPAVTL